MKKVLCLMFSILFVASVSIQAKDRDEDELLSLVTLSNMSATQVKVSSLLGNPTRVEESRKRILWYYSRGKTNLVISWNKKTSLPEKFSFTSEYDSKSCFDHSLSHKLQSGKTDMAQAITLLGTPKDMTIKPTKQEMYYSYQNKMLRLFFRDRRLVDYCLY